MKVVMISNYINHHQIPYSQAMYERLGNSYHFIQTEEMEQKRIEMGWAVDPNTIPYVVLSYNKPEYSKELIDECDLLIVGWIQDEHIIKDRLNSGKMVIRISERLYREGQWKFISPKGLIRKYLDHTRYNNKPVYLFCNGAYVASDYKLIHAYKDKMYKFGYFPKARYYYDTRVLWNQKSSIDTIHIEHKEELPEEPPTLTAKEIEIVWAGRFIELKHPEYMVRMAADLCRLGYRFNIHMVGSGPMEEQLKMLAEYEMIEDYITFHGFLGPEKVRDIMEKSHIHIFTSNFLEGWGAVVNEGMNAGCAEIVNDEVGAAYHLIEDGKNGVLYHESDYKDLLKQVVKLFERPYLIKQYGMAAYDTIATEWNAEEACNRTLALFDAWERGEEVEYKSGPVSKAVAYKPKFWQSGKLNE